MSITKCYSSLYHSHSHPSIEHTCLDTFFSDPTHCYTLLHLVIHCYTTLTPCYTPVTPITPVEPVTLVPPATLVTPVVTVTPLTLVTLLLPFLIPASPEIVSLQNFRVKIQSCTSTTCFFCFDINIMAFVTASTTWIFFQHQQHCFCFVPM